nr:ORF1 [Torque teno arctocephalus australis virus 3]
MVFYYRRRWGRYRQRPWTRRRSGFYRPYRSRRRGYRRRQTVRRRRRRRPRTRRYRRKTERVITWRPPRVVKCRMHGWDIGIASAAPYFSDPGETLFKNNVMSIYRPTGGGVSVKTLSLQYFYQENVSHKNRWSKSNENFDLARYFGTKIYLRRHQTISYIFWYESEFGDTSQENYQNLHPAALLIKRRRRLVLSKDLGGKKTHKIFIRPPSTLESKWYSMSSWCKVNLAKIGFTAVNFNNPFWHRGQSSFGVWIGYHGPSNASLASPPKWKKDWDNYTKPCMYRWYWDSGESNYILMNDNHYDYGSPNALTVKRIEIPYYQYFYGHAAQGQQKTSTGGTWNPIYNPNYLAIWWYADEAIIDGNIKKVNKFIQDPSQTSLQNNRTWVLLWSKDGSQLPTQGTGAYDTPDKLPNVSTVNTILNSLCTYSPFVIHGLDRIDISRSDPVINIPFFYTSLWQWGGAPYNPTEPTNPCPNNPANTDSFGVRISNPATVALDNLHPWDLDSQGVVTRPTLLRVLRDIFTTGTPGLQPTETPIEREEGEEQEQSSSSGSSITSASSSNSSTDTEEEEETPAEATQALRQQLQKVQRRMELEQQVKQRIIARLKSLGTS